MTDGDAAGASRKRQRHFWEGPDQEEEKQSSAHAAPVARLYRHALESVFAFVKLADLGRILAVSRSWAAAVRSLKSIAAEVERPLLQPSVLCASSLAPHVATVLWYTPASPIVCGLKEMQLLATRLPSLTSLSCQVVVPQPQPLPFSAMLVALNLGFTCAATAAPSINATIVIISQLPLLNKLALDFPRFYAKISFAPLAPMALIELRLAVPDGVKSQLTNAQFDQLRLMPQLRTLMVDNVSNPALKRLLRAPHQLQWQCIHELVELDSSCGAALTTLPTLTELQTEICRTVGFLPALVQLRVLKLFFDRPWAAHAALRPWPVSADAVVSALSHCPLLQNLSLCAPVTSKHMSTLLPQLAALEVLGLVSCEELLSLSFFADSSSALLLRQLDIADCHHPALHATEIQWLQSLTALQSLRIVNSFAEPLNRSIIALLTPPSGLIRTLAQFAYEPRS